MKMSISPSLYMSIALSFVVKYTYTNGLDKNGTIQHSKTAFETTT